MENNNYTYGDIIDINRFENNEAEAIFESVKQTGIKVVMKDGQPEYVLLAPETYLQLMNEMENVKLRLLTAERMLGSDSKEGREVHQAVEELNITEEDLDSLDDFSL